MPILYGLTDQIEAWQGRSAAEVADAVSKLGGDGVFLKHLDPAWIDALHHAGVRVYVSHAVFVDREGENLWQRWPDSRPITATGAHASQEEWYRPLRPTHADVRALRLEQLTQLITDLPIDGVWLDFIRWPARWEKPTLTLYDSAFDDDTIDQFAAETGLNAPAGPPASRARWILGQALPQWIDWRCAVIERFVIDAVATVHHHRPNATVGLFTIPWTGTALDQTCINAANHRIVGQDLARLGRHVDVISPMVYHRLCGRSIDWIATVTRTATEQSIAAVWPVIEAIDPPDRYSSAEFAAVLHTARNAGSGEVIIFKIDGILSDPNKQATISTLRKQRRQD